LDSGWLNQALDIVTEAGGSLRMTTLSLAERKDQESRAVLRVVAPSRECLEGILVELMEVGAKPLESGRVLERAVRLTCVRMSLATVPNLRKSGLAVVPKAIAEIANDISRFREPLHVARFPFDLQNRDRRSAHRLDQLAVMVSILLCVAKRDLETQ
jgi:hypothetical protein